MQVRYYVEEIPGIVGAALMVAPDATCAVARQIGAFFRTRADAERRAAELNATWRAALAAATGAR